MMRAKRVREAVETPAYIEMLGRMIRAGGRRVADADEVELRSLVTLREEVEAAISLAVAGQRRRGMSWAYIGQAVGTTRQAAQMRYGGK